MKVAEVMTKNVEFCTPETNLAAAAIQMWNADCGALPVVDDVGRVIGMITDRDICIAASTRHQDVADIKVSDVPTGKVQSCTPEANVTDALKIFRQARVRRLPIVDKDAKLLGILSISDIALHAGEARDKSLSYEEVVNTFKAICSQRAKGATAGV